MAWHGMLAILRPAEKQVQAQAWRRQTCRSYAALLLVGASACMLGEGGANDVKGHVCLPGRTVHLEEDLCMPMGSVIEAQHSQRPDDLHAWGSQRHKYHALLLVLGRLRAALAHEDGYVAARVAGSAGPPLVAVKNPARGIPAMPWNPVSDPQAAKQKKSSVGGRRSAITVALSCQTG